MTEDEAKAMLASIRNIEMCLLILTGALIGALALRYPYTERLVDAETGQG